MVQDVEYAYAAGRVRAREARLLDKSRLERMLEAPDPDEALRYLSETPYGRWMEGSARPDPEAMFDSEADDALDEAVKACPDRALVDLLRVEKAFLALKRDLREILFGLAERPREGDLVAAEAEAAGRRAGGDDSFWSARRAAGDDEAFWHVGSLAAVTAREAAALRAAGGLSTPLELDVYLDGCLFEIAKIKAGLCRNEVISRIWMARIDSANILSMFRIKHRDKSASELEEVLVGFSFGRAWRDLRRGFGRVEEADEGGSSRLEPSVKKDVLLAAFAEPWERVPAAFRFTPYAEAVAKGTEVYLKEKSFWGLEKALDDHLISVARRAKLVSMGPEVVVGFLLAKEMEIKNLRLLFGGRSSGWPIETIRERLRERY